MNEWSLFKSTPNEIALFAFLFGFTLAEPLTIEEQNVLGNFFFETGQILFTIASQRTLLEAIQKEQQKETSDKDKDNQNHNHKKQADQTSEEKIQQQIEQMLNQNQELQRQIQQLQDQIDQLKQSR